MTAQIIWNVLSNTFKDRLFFSLCLKILLKLLPEKKPTEAYISWLSQVSISSSEGIEKYSLQDAPFDKESLPLLRKHLDARALRSDRPNSKKRTRMGSVVDVDFIYAFVLTKSLAQVLECGVSMGGSTVAILSAHEKIEGKSHLYSSDLPYLWLKNSSANVGKFVPPSLQKNWSLFLGHDLLNLRRIFKKQRTFDLVLYDSDKTLCARLLFVRMLKKYRVNFKYLIFDDIGDNDHFKQVIETMDNVSDYTVIEFAGKYFGMIERAKA